MPILPAICSNKTMIAGFLMYSIFGIFTIITSLLVFISIIKSSHLRRKLVLTVKYFIFATLHLHMEPFNLIVCKRTKIVFLVGVGLPHCFHTL